MERWSPQAWPDGSVRFRSRCVTGLEAMVGVTGETADWKRATGGSKGRTAGIAGSYGKRHGFGRPYPGFLGRGDFVRRIVPDPHIRSHCDPDLRVLAGRSAALAPWSGLAPLPEPRRARSRGPCPGLGDSPLSGRLGRRWAGGRAGTSPCLARPSPVRIGRGPLPGGPAGGRKGLSRHILAPLLRRGSAVSNGPPAPTLRPVRTRGAVRRRRPTRCASWPRPPLTATSERPATPTGPSPAAAPPGGQHRREPCSRRSGGDALGALRSLLAQNHVGTAGASRVQPREDAGVVRPAGGPRHGDERAGDGVALRLRPTGGREQRRDLGRLVDVQCPTAWPKRGYRPPGRDLGARIARREPLREAARHAQPRRPGGKARLPTGHLPREEDLRGEVVVPRIAHQARELAQHVLREGPPLPRTSSLPHPGRRA